jgi:hypothetical protein
MTPIEILAIVGLGASAAIAAAWISHKIGEMRPWHFSRTRWKIRLFLDRLKTLVLRLSAILIPMLIGAATISQCAKYQ